MTDCAQTHGGQLGSSGLVLAVETSCDETAVAIVDDAFALRASAVASQAAIHARFGGVVPEVASRNHLPAVAPLVRAALREAGVDLRDVGAFAATAGPGLPSALLVGMAYAKSLAAGCGKPFISVNHLEGHLLSPYFGCATVPPHVGLIVSGGHTVLADVAGFGRYRVLGQTADDAAGEAFDKVAKLLGLGYPGGVEIERLAAAGDAARYPLPRAMLHSGDWAFSFSGLKTAVRLLVEREGDALSLPDACASFQAAVIEVLAAKSVRAAAACGRGEIALSGGVSANGALRQALRAACGEAGIRLVVAEAGLRTDNAAMIAFAAAHGLRVFGPSGLGTDIRPTAPANPLERIGAGTVQSGV